MADMRRGAKKVGGAVKRKVSKYREQRAQKRRKEQETRRKEQEAYRKAYERGRVARVRRAGFKAGQKKPSQDWGWDWLVGKKQTSKRSLFAPFGYKPAPTPKKQVPHKKQVATIRTNNAVIEISVRKAKTTRKKRQGTTKRRRSS